MFLVLNNREVLVVRSFKANPFLIEHPWLLLKHQCVSFAEDIGKLRKFDGGIEMKSSIPVLIPIPIPACNSSSNSGIWIDHDAKKSNSGIGPSPGWNTLNLHGKLWKSLKNYTNFVFRKQRGYLAFITLMPHFPSNIYMLHGLLVPGSLQCLPSTNGLYASVSISPLYS